MRFWTRLGSLRPPFFRMSRSRAPGELPKLAIVTCIKNEGEDLVEWLCFHRHIGVSEFVIYDNLSTDATSRVLASVPFRDEIRVHRVRKGYPQKAAFRNALWRYRSALDWVAFLDGDEYVVPLGQKSLPEKLAGLESEHISGFGIYWRIFGSSGFETRPDGLLTESFTRRAADDFDQNGHVKSIVRIADVQRLVTQHFFKTSGPYRLGDGSAPAPGFRGVADQAGFSEGFAIHHYITKSREQCFRKIARGRPRPNASKTKYRQPDYWDFGDRNEVEDDRAAVIISPIRDSVLKLRDTIGRD